MPENNTFRLLALCHPMCAIQWSPIGVSLSNASMFADALCKPLKRPAYAIMRLNFVPAHKQSRIDHVGMKNYGQPAGMLNRHISHALILRNERR